ncbi:hypothetical protein [Arthrobacter sp. IK3]|uniref:hypothetical protein n=1 Tax=Arthrobacter sp. IK3 TaxID=3448169 RepID=UPI003EDFA1EB
MGREHTAGPDLAQRVPRTDRRAVLYQLADDGASGEAAVSLTAHVLEHGYHRRVETAAPVTSADVIMFLGELGLDKPANPRQTVDSQVGSVRFHASRSGTRALNIVFRHLRHIQRAIEPEEGTND